VVFDLPGGSAAYAIRVRLVARRPVTITDCGLVTDWDNDITLVGYFDDREPVWWLGQQDFPKRQVLNPRIMDNLRFRGYDDTVGGVILITGLKPMPKELHHGMVVPSTMAFLDQNRDEICHRPELFVDRTWKRERVALTRRSLFAAEDIPEMRIKPLNREDSGAPATQHTTPITRGKEES
jgi:hypothetical protein